MTGESDPLAWASELEVDELAPAELASEHEGVEAGSVKGAADVPGSTPDHVEVLADILHDLVQEQRNDQGRQRQQVGQRWNRRASEDRLEHPLDLSQRMGSEQKPAEADHVEGGDHSHELPAGAVDPIGGPDAIEPGTAEPVCHQQDALISAPEYERPGGPVPEAADDHGQHQIATELPCAATVASQRNVQVVAQPGGEADVPAGPEVLRAGREVRQIEVQGQLEAQALGDPPRRVRVAGEVAVDLEREGVD